MPNPYRWPSLPNRQCQLLSSWLPQHHTFAGFPSISLSVPWVPLFLSAVLSLLKPVYPGAQALAPLSINTHSYGTSSSPMISGGIHILMDPSCIISSYLSLGPKLAYSSENFASPPGCLISNANSVTKSELLLFYPSSFHLVASSNYFKSDWSCHP